MDVPSLPAVDHPNSHLTSERLYRSCAELDRHCSLNNTGSSRLRDDATALVEYIGRSIKNVLPFPSPSDWNPCDVHHSHMYREG